MKIYTKTGDDGTTGLRGNTRVRKDSPRIEAYGEVDELNAVLGVILAHLPRSAENARGWLTSIQNDLFVIGALLATPPSAPRNDVVLEPRRVEALEQQIDQMEKTLPPLKNFILPQGIPAGALAHLARTVSRRAERRVVALGALETVLPVIVTYLNRVSDFLFVLARWINHQEGSPETAWINAAGAVAVDGVQPDRLSANLHKLEAEKEKRKTLFEKASEDLQKKKENAARAFRDSVDQVKKEGGKVDKPFREIDLD